MVTRRALTGAWIETNKIGLPSRVNTSRALTGAWIETRFNLEEASNLIVAPSRARGLKRGKRLKQ